MAYASRAAMVEHALANTLTCANLASGVAAMLIDDDNRSVRRSRLILLGVVCDGFDGTLARHAKSATVLGARADGIADTVTCGIAATAMLARQREASDDPLVRLAPYLYGAAVGWRVVTIGFPVRTSHIFRGLPIVGAGTALALSAQLRLRPRVTSCMAIAAAAAMVSPFPFPSAEAVLRWRKVSTRGYRV